MSYDVERGLSEDIVYSVNNNLEERVVSAWREYNLYIKELRRNNNPYDKRLYLLNYRIYKEWKTSLKNKKKTT